MRLPILAAASAALLASSALAAPRAALVIGNETYLTGQPAPGAGAAAQQAAAMLEAAGFAVTLDLDLDGGSVAAALAEFEDHVRDAEIALVVYVGRAVSFGGTTWIVPVDADADSLTELGLNSLPLALPLGIARRAKAAALVFDGAWPARFDERPGLGVGSFHEGPGVRPGLSAMPDPGALVVAAAPPGAEPPPRDGAAPFALRAIEALLGPDADLAGGEERLRGALPDAHLVGALGSEAALAVPTPEEGAEEIEFWRRAEATESAEGYAAYLERYPNGYYAHAARDRLEALQGGDEGFAANREDALALDAEQRRAILAALSVEGLPAGEDPLGFGPDARAAIRAWQAGNGEAPTGFLTREQARALLGAAEDR